MSYAKIYNLYKAKWWALPLILPFLLLPLARMVNTFTWVADGSVVLYYLPLSLFLSLMLFYGWAALPGIVLSLAWHYYPQTSAPETLLKILHFIVPVVVSWGGYRVFVTRRHNISYGNAELTAQRMFWQVLCPATLFLLIFHTITWLGLYDKYQALTGVTPFSLRTLINYQALLVSGLTGTPFCYLLLRVIHHPRHLKGYLSRLRQDFDPKATRLEVVAWFAVIALLMVLMLSPWNESASIFSTNYTLSLLLPVMLWGSMRYGYRLMSIVWTPFMMVSIHYFYRYTPVSPHYDIQLTILSSSYLVFSFIITWMSMLATRQRVMHERVSRLAWLDPVLNMPNLRALNRALADTPWSVLCFLRIPDLELLGRHYGIMLRIQYKQMLSEWLQKSLQSNECVYHLSGYDIVLRLNTESHALRIAELDTLIKQFRFAWDGMPLQPQVGMSYCYVRSPVSHLYLLLGELSTTADLSLETQRPESLQHRGAVNLQRSLKGKVEMMNRLQRALEADRFCLMAQPIAGVRGDDYHEILLRMPGDDNELIGPDAFLPVAHEFGLASRIDLWVIEHTLRFMAHYRETEPGARFSINLSPTSVCRSNFAREVAVLLERYNVEAWQLIFEVTESNSLTNINQANQTLGQLKQLGCRVAIDDFGTGYASYARLKNVNADILKIDGSFIRNLTSNSLDYQIVASICHLARMKKMRVVAEYVESEEVRSAAVSLGIDYLQGYLIGKPAPLETLGGDAQALSKRAWAVEGQGSADQAATPEECSSSILSSQPVTAPQ
ncbi:sensor domain-containing phosphodiesterase [Escherichia sp. ESNIH1]|uniref:EAL domain-containing protein n=1 Tax=Escherichia sp. ESNIH1 TaxID=1985876 RepID=UPI000CDD1EB1|nr:EAL domain-containing protein [Escherichia sp. ESNIH1]POU03031.1 sensor domain-containing phosphodiesterase [Escherichia sp. ESNIH1]